MWDLDTLIRLNEEAAARELGRREQPPPAAGYLYLVQPHPGRALTRDEARQRLTLIKGGKL